MCKLCYYTIQFHLPRDGKPVPYMQKGLTESVKPFYHTPPVYLINNKPEMVKQIVVTTGQTNIQIHLIPIIFFCSGSLRSAKNFEILMQKEAITVGLITVKQNNKIPMLVYVKTPVLLPIARNKIGTKQYRQYMIWKTDVIFMAFSVFI